jgi:hypothetical protein
VGALCSLNSKKEVSVKISKQNFPVGLNTFANPDPLGK